MIEPNLALAQAMPLPLPPNSIADAFLTQGIIGAVALLAMGVAGYIYREREKDRKQADVDKNALIEKFEKQLAAKDAENQKLQEDRIVEMRTATTELGKALQTVEQVTEGFKVAQEIALKARSAA